jgi:hypothetical protein
VGDFAARAEIKYIIYIYFLYSKKPLADFPYFKGAKQSPPETPVRT